MGNDDRQARTMADIARLARVSTPTVSRALSNSPLVNEETRNHVLLVANRHGYTVNRNAQKLRNKRTNTIAVSLDFHSHPLNHITDPFMFDLLAGVSEALGDRDQDLLLCAPNHNDAAAFEQILRARGADGFIILGQGHREEMLNDFAATGAPIVVWGAGADDAAYCVVGSDNFAGGQLAARYFLDKDRRHFLFVGDTSHREFRRRWEGMCDVADSAGVPIAVDQISLGNFSYDSAYETASRYLDVADNKPDAIFTFSDTVAMAFISAFRAAGIDVPKDVSIVGYNDIPPAKFFCPPITTIRQDTYQAGRVLVAKLMRIIDGDKPGSGKIRTELIVRDT